MTQKEIQEVGLMPVITLVIWLTCLTVGLVGLLMPGRLAPAPATQPATATATEILNVDIAPDPLPPDTGPPPPNNAQNRASDEPAAPSTPAAPAAPELPDVAAPSAAIAFALPVERPVRIVAQRSASPARTAPAGPVAVQHLTFGIGQGIQPAPDYPHESVVHHQQGTVIVRLNVAPDGTVADAQAAVPCPWPLLNQSAVRTVREQWRFSNLAPGTYEVSIDFQLGQ